MELYRRTAKGELAEIMGESALEQDKQRRILGYTEAERWEQFAALSAEEQLVLKAFADGVNAIIAQVNAGKRPMPQRLKELGVTKLRPWKPTDTIAIAHMMAERFGSSGGEELRMLQLRLYLQLKFGAQAMSVLNDLVWQNDPTSPTTVTDGARDGGRGTRKMDGTRDEGRGTVRWERGENRFTLWFALPENVKAEIVLPPFVSETASISAQLAKGEASAPKFEAGHWRVHVSSGARGKLEAKW
jgi:hypothetical protein